jgi:hypothetical protein
MVWTHVMNMGLDLPNMIHGNNDCSSLYTIYTLSLVLRLSHVLHMWIDLLREYQTLHCDMVVINVAFGFVEKHDARHGQSRWDLPLSAWEISVSPSSDWIQKCMVVLRLRVNLVWDSKSHDRERVVSLELNRTSWGKKIEWHVHNIVIVHPIYVCLGVGMSC